MADALGAAIARAIRERGPLPFAAFMSLCLYDPRHGYYASGRVRTGWAGDFVTAPELDPAFGELWAEGFRRIWDACGRPPRTTVVEIGGGEGGLAAAVLAASDGPFADALQYVLVERVAAVQARQRDRVGADPRVRWASSVAELPPVTGCVFANEVLDNLPVHLVEAREGDIHELYVEEAGDGFRFVPGPPSSPEVTAFVARTAGTLEDGIRYEVHLAMESLVAQVAAALSRGAFVVVDYGAEAAELAARPEGSLAGYSPDGAGDLPLQRPGATDLTSHVNWTALRRALDRCGLTPTGPRLQRATLRALGATAMDDRLRRDHRAALDARDGIAAVRSLSRRQALGALLSENGLGGLEVMAGVKGIETPRFLDAPRAG